MQWLLKLAPMRIAIAHHLRAPRVIRERCTASAKVHTARRAARLDGERTAAKVVRAACIADVHQNCQRAPLLRPLAACTAYGSFDCRLDRCGKGAQRLPCSLYCSTAHRARHTCSTLSLRVSLESHRCHGSNLASTGSAAHTHLRRHVRIATSLLAISSELMRPLVFM